MTCTDKTTSNWNSIFLESARFLLSGSQMLKGCTTLFPGYPQVLSPSRGEKLGEGLAP